MLSATGPNRTFLWSGTINANKKHGSFTANDGGDERGKFLPWESYAETLQTAGVSWRVYQCADDYGDNGLEYFNTFAKLDPTQGGTAAPGNVYYDNGVKNVPEPITGLSGNADNLNAAIRADVLNGTLPQVSWVVNNQFFSEHPVTAPSNGAYFLRGLLEALNADPDVFNSTLVIINYDENDGQFDHVPPPMPAPGEEDEFVSGTMGQYGVTAPTPGRARLSRTAHPHLALDARRLGDLGSRPTTPRSSSSSRSGRPRTAQPAISPNISDWRRKVCGDLTGAFDFAKPVYGLPDLPDTGDTHPGDAVHPTAGRQHDADPGGGHQAGPPAALPAERQPDRVHQRAVRRVAKLQFSNVPRSSPRRVTSPSTTIGPDPRSLAQYPAKFPGQYTVAAKETAVRHRRRRLCRRRHRVRPDRHRAEPVPAPVHR